MGNRRSVHKKSWKNFIYFFPLQLIILHVKKNHFLLFLWVLIFGFALGSLAPRFGVPQQFLVPEYRGESNFLSFGIVGFATGGFITGFNLYSYIMHGYRFPFIATLSRPFHKFSLNNFIIPLSFVLTYCWNSSFFQYKKELFEVADILLNLIGYVIGIIAFQTMSYMYFKVTNKDANAFGKASKPNPNNTSAPAPLHQRTKWYKFKREYSKWHVETYLSSPFHLSRARDSEHYQKDILEKVFSQNHVNAARFELLLVISFLAIGNLRFNDYFVIPAAASLLLFFTIMLMLVSALHSWIKGWTVTLFVLVLVALNFFYKELKWISVESRAIGVNYEVEKTKYPPEQFYYPEDTIQKDLQNTIAILEKWKAKTKQEKPKLVVITCSGGGSRSAYWTMRSLIHADSVCGGNLLKHTVMYTGASGGMFGASYLRELTYQNNNNVYTASPQEHCERMAKDLLNPVILSLATNDWFIRFQSVNDGDKVYTADRATAFEAQFNKNTDFILDKRLEDYVQLERNADIPMMILSPTIVKDGRRMLFSAQPISYLTQSESQYMLPEDIEYTRYLSAHEPYKIKWVNALRINATFPYIFPMTTLPTEPAIELMDAGVRDNFGMKTTSEFIHALSSWINENTSGVVIVQVRDLPKYMDLGDNERSLFGKFTSPLGSIYGNMTKGQDYNNQQMLDYLKTSCKHDIDVISFELHQTPESRVSLSWHLSRSEKEHIRRATEDNYYQYQLEKLRALLNN